MNGRILAILATILTAVAFAPAVGTGPGAAAQMATPVADVAMAEAVAPDRHCVDMGGTVVERVPTLTVAQGLLGAPRAFCEFVNGPGATPGTRMSVLAESLASPLPNTAAFAYRSRTPMPALDGPDLQEMVAAPAAYYCRSLGGIESSWQLAGTAAEGVPGQVAICLFPDLSAIDSAGLLGNTMGDVRGADLGPAFAWVDVS